MRIRLPADGKSYRAPRSGIDALRVCAFLGLISLAAILLPRASLAQEDAPPGGEKKPAASSDTDHSGRGSSAPKAPRSSGAKLKPKPKSEPDTAETGAEPSPSNASEAPATGRPPRGAAGRPKSVPGNRRESAAPPDDETKPDGAAGTSAPDEEPADEDTPEPGADRGAERANAEDVTSAQRDLLDAASGETETETGGDAETPAAGAGEPARPGAKPAPTASVVSRATEQSREAAVRESLTKLRAPSETEHRLSEAESLAAVASLVHGARMQLSALRTETSRYEETRDEAKASYADLKRQHERLPVLMREGKLPLLHAENARTRAEQTVAQMNSVFDAAMKRRSELAEAIVAHREDARMAAQVLRRVGNTRLGVAIEAAAQLLDDRVDAVATLIAILDDTVTASVETSETAAQLSLDLTAAIRTSRTRGLLTRTADPMGAQTFANIARELDALSLRAVPAINAAAAGLSSVNPLRGALLTLLGLVLVAAMWVWCTALPTRLVQAPSAAPSRLARAAELLVPATRALLAMLLLTCLSWVWRLPSAWTDAALLVLTAWLAYYLLNYILRELLAPHRREFRLVNLRDEAAQNLYAISQSLALYTAVLLPPISILNGLDDKPSELVRTVGVIYGAGLLAIGLWKMQRAGGIMAMLPSADTRRKISFQRAGRIVLPLCAVGIFGGVIAAAGGFSNLSMFLNRSLSLEILLLIAAVFVHSLVLETGPEETQAVWRHYSRGVFWAALVMLQFPIWRLHLYHFAYVFDVLSMPLMSVDGSTVTGLSIVKGLLAVLVSYGAARLLRDKLQTWEYLTRRFQSGVAYAVSSLSFYIIITAGLLWGILAAGFQLTVLTVFAGMAGIGLGFGLQDIVKNFVSGLILLIERPVAVGDFVEVEGLRGHITAINLRSTTIRSRENNIVLVPNSDLAATRVTNLTLSDPRVRIDIAAGVSYKSDLKVVRELLLQCAADNPDVLKYPQSEALLMDFGESSVDFVLRAWVKDADVAITATPALRQQIWDIFREHNVEIPFPQRDLHLRSSDLPLPWADADYAGPDDPRDDETPQR